MAFPGGFVDYNEDPKDSVLRELKEECNLLGKNPRVVKSFKRKIERIRRLEIYSYLCSVGKRSRYFFESSFELRRAWWEG